MGGRLVITITLGLAVLTALIDWSAPASADLATDDALQRQQHRQVLRERWRDASPAERHHIRQLALDHWAATPADERRQVRERRDRRASREATPRDMKRRDIKQPTTSAERSEIRRYLRSLSPEERRALRSRVEKYRTLDESDRMRFRQALRQFRRLPPEKQQRFRANARRWKDMSPHQKSRLRDKMSVLRAMEPEQRLELLERVLADSASAAPSAAED